MNAKTEPRKIPNPLYAAAGAGELAYEQLRRLPERVAELRGRVADLRPVVAEAVPLPVSVPVPVEDPVPVDVPVCAALVPAFFATVFGVPLAWLNSRMTASAPSRDRMTLAIRTSPASRA